MRERANARAIRLAVAFSICLTALYPAHGETSAAAERVTVWGPTVVQSRVIHRVNPDLQNIRGRISGIAIVEFWLNDRGDVVMVNVMNRKPSPINDAVVAAARQWKFQPATIAGVAVPSVHTLTVGYSN